MRFFFIIPFLLFFGLTKDLCQCPPTNKKIIETLKKDSEFIFMGTAIEELETESAFDTPMYKFKVDSILKGKKQPKTIIINQNEAGNCSRYFKIGHKYYVIGNEVDDLKEVYTMTQKEHSKNLEKMIKENKVLETDGCRSFSIGDNIIEIWFSD